MNCSFPDDLFDSITITTVSTRTYSLQHLDSPPHFFDGTYDQHLTLHSLASFKEELSNDIGGVRSQLRILNNSCVVKIVEFPREKVSSTAVLEKGTHKINYDNLYDPTIKTHKLRLHKGRLQQLVQHLPFLI
jgi:hypothetical protein